MKKIVTFLYNIVRRFLEERFTQRAAGLVYATVLAIIPIGVLVLGVISALQLPEEIGENIQKFIVANFISGSAEEAIGFLEKYWSQTREFSWINFIFLLAIGVSFLLTIDEIFNDIWRIKKKRSFFIAIPIYVLILIFGPLLIGGSILLSVTLFSLKGLSHLQIGIIDLSTMQNLFLQLLPVVLTFLGFLGSYRFIPNTHVYWQSATVGAVFSTVALEVSKWGFGKYVLYSTTYKYLYGFLAIIPLFLLWVHIFWLIILFSAMLSYHWQNSITRLSHSKKT